MKIAQKNQVWWNADVVQCYFIAITHEMHTTILSVVCRTEERDRNNMCLVWIIVKMLFVWQATKSHELIQLEWVARKGRNRWKWYWIHKSLAVSIKVKFLNNVKMFCFQRHEDCAWLSIQFIQNTCNLRPYSTELLALRSFRTCSDNSGVMNSLHSFDIIRNSQFYVASGANSKIIVDVVRQLCCIPTYMS
jgi:hypothetical protein